MNVEELPGDWDARAEPSEDALLAQASLPSMEERTRMATVCEFLTPERTSLLRDAVCSSLVRVLKRELGN